MKVLFITHELPRDRAQAAASLEVRLAAALRGEDVEVVIVAPGGQDEDRQDIDGVVVERFRVPKRQSALAVTDAGPRGVPTWEARLTTLRFLGAEFTGAVRARRAFEPELVHAHWWFPGGLVGTWVSALGNLPLVTSLHRADLRSARVGAFARPLFRHVMKQSAIVTADSQGLARKARGVMTATNPVIAPMPAATDIFVPGGERAPDRLLAVTSLEPSNGVDQLLEAMATMRTQVSLDLVGEGDAEPKLREVAASMGIADRVRWHARVDEATLVKLCQEATALVIPTLHDWLPLTAIHALLCRTPVVAFDFGGITDVVQHGRTGILVPPSNTLALARALDSLLARSDRGATLGDAGRMYALATFAPESVARRFAGIYRQALAPPAA